MGVQIFGAAEEFVMFIVDAAGVVMFFGFSANLFVSLHRAVVLVGRTPGTGRVDLVTFIFCKRLVRLEDCIKTAND